MEILVQKRVVAHKNQIAALEDFISMLLMAQSLSKCNHFVLFCFYLEWFIYSFYYISSYGVSVLNM